VFVSVAIDLALDRLFTYSVPAGLTEKLRIGQLLRVTFGRRSARGFAMRLSDVPPVGADGKPIPVERIKPIAAIEDEAPFFSPAVLDLVSWIAKYTASPLETCLKAAVPAAVLKPGAGPVERLFVEPVVPAPAVELTARQKTLAADVARLGGGWLQSLCRELETTPGTLKKLAEKGVVAIATRVLRRDPLAGRKVMASKPLDLNPLQKKALDVILSDEAAAKPVLLYGVTGSGKTEIYLQAISRMLEAGRGAIALVPEIALTPQTVRRFAGRFGDRVAVLHSGLSDGERHDEWQRIRRGEATVVVGPRSAVFAPVRDLGLIVVDEEHDGSYKQSETPRYHARDVAVVRARLEGARVVLGSATPALESWLNAKTGKYLLASVPARVAGRSLPSVHLVNLEEEAQRLGHVPIFSQLLLEALHARLDRGEQAILFLNRRGWSRAWECPACGWVATCPKCDVSYTYHKADRCLRCHICGGWMRLPETCPDCHASEFETPGIGTQRAEAALAKCFPSARILRMDADSTSRKASHDDILSAFRARQADILIGTQMIAKGLDFPNVTLVGVLNADTSLNLPDFRAGERTYQLLAQVSGRAGRAEKPGEVYIQTFAPDAPPVKASADGSAYDVFADFELKQRKDGYYPPYCRLATLVLRSQNEGLAGEWAALWAKSLASVKKPGFVVSEAVPAVRAKADGWFRQQIVLRAAKASDIVSAVKWIASARPLPKAVLAAFDVDAVDLF